MRNFGHFRPPIFGLSSISKKLKRFRTFELYFRKQLTIEVIWAKYEEIRNFTSVISFLKLLRVSYFPLEMVSDCISHLGCLVDVLLEVEHTIKKR